MIRAFATGLLVIALSAPAAFAEQKARPQAQQGDATALQIRKMAIDGAASTAVGCVTGTFYNMHVLGAVVRGTRIRVDITGVDFDPIAAVVILQMGPQAPGNVRAGYAFDDDSGGGNDPRIEFTAEYDGSVVLSVGSYDGTVGCYATKVQVTFP